MQKNERDIVQIIVKALEKMSASQKDRFMLFAEGVAACSVIKQGGKAAHEEPERSLKNE